MLENEHVKLSWNFEYNMKESTARRPDATIDYKERKVIHMVDMTCPCEKNVLKKNKEKRQKYQQLTFEVRERRQRYRVEMIPIVIGCIGEGVGVMREQVRKILINSDADKVCREMLRTAVMEPKSIHSKVITNIVTGG